MKLQNLIVIFIIIIIPVILLVSLYINNGIKTIKYQSLYDTGLVTATHDAIYAFELNTTNDAYSDNAETKRNLLKSSVKAFEKSLCNTCGISSYNTSEIEEYIPAIAFGMYDGFYMYAPSLSPKTNEYKHSLKNYVYYSEELSDGTIIRYSLDNYVVVLTNLDKNNLTNVDNNKYKIREGNLIVEDNWKIIKEKDVNDEEAKNYYDEAKDFTEWFNKFIEDKKEQNYYYLKISAENDPEDENSAFVQHKREVIKNKLENVLNSSITAYAERTKKNYKMPKLSEEDWQKVYSNISMITFFQGKNIGLTKYNGYCVLNSTNSNEYVNPNLIYFVDKNNEYHDIRCEAIKNQNNLKGYRIGRFQRKKLEELKTKNGEIEKDEKGNILYIKEKDEEDNVKQTTTSKYKYEIEAYACYNCINGPLQNNTKIYNYIKDSKTNSNIKKAYYTALARERYNTIHLNK